MSKRGKVRKTAVAASIGYEIGTRCRKRIAEIFGWGKITGGLARLKRRGLGTVNAVFVSGMAACNIVRPPKLLLSTVAVCRDGGN